MRFRPAMHGDRRPAVRQSETAIATLTLKRVVLVRRGSVKAPIATASTLGAILGVGKFPRRARQQVVNGQDFLDCVDIRRLADHHVFEHEM